MTENEKALQLLTEIRDMQHEQLSILRTRQIFIEKDRRTAHIITGIKIILIIGVGAAVAGAFYLLYSSITNMFSIF